MSLLRSGREEYFLVLSFSTSLSLTQLSLGKVSRCILGTLKQPHEEACEVRKGRPPTHNQDLWPPANSDECESLYKQFLQLQPSPQTPTALVEILAATS